MIRAKTKAFLLHLMCSTLVVTVAIFAVFWVWFPNNLASVLSGGDVLAYVVVIELILGPLMTLVIYNSSKPRRELFTDYAIIILIQLGMLTYGLSVLAKARPVYIVFVKDRMEVVTALELDVDDLSEANQDYSTLSWLGPKQVCIRSDLTEKERSFLLFSGIDGKDVELFPKFYSKCDWSDVVSKMYPPSMLAEIFERGGLAEELGASDINGWSDAYWLPVKHRFGFGVELFFEQGFGSRRVLDINPYES